MEINFLPRAASNKKILLEAYIECHCDKRMARRGDLTMKDKDFGAIAQLGERLLCTQEVDGSIPSGSTMIL